MIVLDEQLLGRDIEPDIVCFAIPDSRVREIPQSLRVLVRHDEFRTKARRMGKIIRIKNEDVQYYTATERSIRKLAP